MQRPGVRLNCPLRVRDGDAWFRAGDETEDGFASVGRPVLATAVTRGKAFVARPA
ncbi:hypothetical protein [Streptomyces sp. NPDC017520]|uniref:hypothetical protein n=1 Tax=Streptomyces sp. NPDC017520 TaxID=3364998 RepID=UPI00379EB43A